MNISFELKDKTQDVSPIRMVVTHRGKRFRKAVGISVKRTEWRPKNKLKPCTNIDICDRLREIRNTLESMVNDASTTEEVEQAISRLFDPHLTTKVDGNPTYWEYWSVFAQKEVASKRQRVLAMNVIKKLMGDKDNWEDVDSAYYYRLKQKMNAEGFSQNYQSTLITKLKTVMSEGRKLKYHSNEDYRDFAKSYEESDTVYLTRDELDRLERLELNDPMEREVRDLFLLGVYTASRYSDYSRLTLENEKYGLLQFTQLKTNGTVMLPLSPKVHDILVRNGGRAPQIHQNTFNREIKTVCLKAGLTDEVEVRRSHGESHETIRKPKYKMVSSHTARRTGATLLYMSGIPAPQVMMLTGHTTESSFMRYIRVTKEENARQLADNAFFK